MMNQWQRTWCYVAGLLLLGQTVIAQPRSQPVTSRIDRVTVFTKGAQTVRRSKAALQQGRNELVFTGISPTLDPRSLQVRGEGTFTILSVVHQLNSITEAKQAEDLTELNSQRQTVKKRMTTDQKLLEVFKNEEKLLKDNQNVSTVSVGVKTAELKELADFQRTRLTEVLMKQLDIEGRLQQSDSLLKRIDQRLRNYSGPREIASSEVVVTISAVAATNGLFEISYYVPNAGWFPNYDLRVKDVNNPVEITLKANVSQQSGEDWRDVKLTVSTGNPTESSVAPGLLPWRVGFGYPQVPSFNATIDGAVSGRVRDRSGGLAIPGVSVAVKGTTLGTITDATGSYSILMPKGAKNLLFSFIGYDSQEITVRERITNVLMEPSTQALQEVVVVGNSIGSTKKQRAAPSITPLATTETYQPTTISYDIDEPYTILTDGKVYVADIKTISAAADYEYRVVPKVDKDAFLTARIKDWKELDLPEGEARLFLEGAYLGKTLLDVRSTDDTLNISLGRDKGIVVERKRLKDVSSAGFLSGNKTVNRGFDITISNNKRQPIRIIVQDQFPVSAEKDIVVEEIEAKGAEVDKETKIITWTDDLPARQTKKHVFRYSVKHPKNQVVVLE